MQRDSKREVKQNVKMLFEKHKNEARRLMKQNEKLRALEEYQKALVLIPEDLDARQRSAEIIGELKGENEEFSQYQLIASKALAISNIMLLHMDNKGEPPEDNKLTADKKADPTPCTLDKGKIISLDIPLFSNLEPQEFLELLQSFEIINVAAGQRFITENEIGDTMYILVSGKVDIVREIDGKSEKVAEMLPGCFFGEIALISDIPRLASAYAKTDSILLAINRVILAEIDRKYPEVKKVIECFHFERLVKNVLSSSPILRGMDSEQVVNAMEFFEATSFEPGTRLLTQGEPGAGFFLILRGNCSVWSTDDRGNVQEYPELAEGDFFGEISLLLDIPVTATVTTKERSTILKMNADDFQKIIKNQKEMAEKISEVGQERLNRTKGYTKKGDLVKALL